MASTYDERMLKSTQDQSAQQTQTQNAQNQKAFEANMKGLSDATKTQLGTLQQGYQPSTAVQAAQGYLKDLQAAKPQDYASQYDADIQSAYQQIMNRPGFKYDPNADALFQQYKDEYMRQGQRAMVDTMGQAAAMTGGYGNSYAQTAGQQQYQSYLAQINSAMPEFYSMAADQYAREGDNLLNLYQTALTADEQAYGRWSDAYGRWQNELAAAENSYNTERGYDYGKYQDNLNYWQSIANAEQNNYWQGQSQAYQTAMAMIQNGQTPSAELLNAANLSAEEAAALQSIYASQRSSGGGPRRTPPAADPTVSFDDMLDLYIEEVRNNGGNTASADKLLNMWDGSADSKNSISTRGKIMGTVASTADKVKAEMKAIWPFTKKEEEK